MRRVKPVKYVLKILLLITIFYSTSSLADVEKWSLYVGLSAKQLSLDVYEKGQASPEGILTDVFLVTPEFGIESSTSSISSNFVYKYAIGLGVFKMDTQELNGKDIDLNTSGKGYYLYAMPVLGFEFLKGKNDKSLLVGLGVGIGYLKAKGDIIFTESTSNLKHDFDFSEFTYSIGLIVDYNVNRWSFSASLYGPEVTKGNYEYNLFDFGMSVRRRFEI